MNPMSKELTAFRDETLYTLRQAKTPEAFSNVLKRTIYEIGFSHFDITEIYGDSNLKLMLSNIPNTLIDTYFCEGLDREDIFNEFIGNASSSVFYSDLFLYFSSCPFALRQIEKTMLVHELLTNYGFYDSYSVPMIVKKTNSKIVFSLQCESVKLNEFKQLIRDRKAYIVILSKIINLLLEQNWFILNDDGNEGEQIKLMSKEIAILEAMGKYGLTQVQAADYVGLADSSVRTYCKHSKRKLGTRTLPNAVYKALKMGIIT